MADNIVDGLFGISPWQAQQQQRAAIDAMALQRAQLDPFQRASMGMYQGGAQLGNIAGGMLGMEDAAVAEAKARETALSGLDTSNPDAILQRAAQVQDPRLKMKLTQLAQQLKYQQQEIATKQAQESLTLARANTEWTKEQREKYSSFGQQLIDMGLKPGSPEFQAEMKRYIEAQLTEKTKPVGTRITNTVGKGDSKYAEERLSGLAKDMQALDKSATSAYKANKSLDRFIEASKTGTEGGAQPIISAAQNLLASFGYSPESLKDVRVMEQAVGDILGTKMEELGARGLTDKDMEVLRQALPRVNIDKNSRLEVAKIVKKANDFTINEWENARSEEERIYPEIAGRVAKPAWYKDWKKTNTSIVGNTSGLPQGSKLIGKTPEGKEVYQSPDGKKWVQ